MNSVSLVGRLTKDAEVRTGNMAVARFTVAVNRSKKDEADFISCVAFDKTAEFIEKYFSKGMSIGINGHIQTGSYVNKDNVRVYTTDVVVDRCEFVGSKSENNSIPEAIPDAAPSGFVPVDDGFQETLPFN